MFDFYLFLLWKAGRVDGMDYCCGNFFFVLKNLFGMQKVKEVKAETSPSLSNGGTT